VRWTVTTSLRVQTLDVQLDGSTHSTASASVSFALLIETCCLLSSLRNIVFTLRSFSLCVLSVNNNGGLQ